MAFTIWKSAREYKFLISTTSGEQPTIAQIDARTIGFNAADNLWFLKDSSTGTVVQVNASMVTGIAGANAVPVARTNNPIVGANKPNQNIASLDAAIGVTTTSVKTIVAANSVNANLSLLDACLRTKTIKKTIGMVGVAGCDFNFVTAANTTKQNIDLGAIIPAFARVRDVVAITTTLIAGTGLSAFGVEAGNVSAGAQHWASADLIAANAIGQQAVGASYTPLAIVAPASNVFISGTPTGANWAAVTAGVLTIYVTYTERS